MIWPPRRPKTSLAHRSIRFISIDQQVCLILFFSTRLNFSFAKKQRRRANEGQNKGSNVSKLSASCPFFAFPLCPTTSRLDKQRSKSTTITHSFDYPFFLHHEYHRGRYLQLASFLSFPCAFRLDIFCLVLSVRQSAVNGSGVLFNAPLTGNCTLSNSRLRKIPLSLLCYQMGWLGSRYNHDFALYMHPIVRRGLKEKGEFKRILISKCMCLFNPWHPAPASVHT